MEEVAAPRPWQGPKQKKKKNAVGEYGKSLVGGGALFQRMFRAPSQRVVKTKVFRKTRSYKKRGTAKGYYSKANIAERKEQRKMAKEEKAMRKLNAPVKQKRKYVRNQKYTKKQIVICLQL